MVDTIHWLAKALRRSLRSGLFGLLISGSAAYAAESDTRTLLAKVKTAYLFNIAKFVHWPESASEVNLCIDSRSALAPYVQKLDQRDIGGSRQLRVFSVGRAANHCQIYYSERPESVVQASTVVLNSLSRSTVANPAHLLLISDHPDSLARGYGMQLQVDGSRLRFRYSPEILANQKFQVSSKLLALAMR